MEHVKWSAWTMRIYLLCWSTFLMAASGEELASTAAVRYWETMLHGGSMPSTIQAMLSPLSSHQATQLLLHTDAYLPTHATSFCEAAHIQCGRNTPKLPGSDDPDDANVSSGYYYRKAAIAKVEPGRRPASNDPDDANLFSYKHYGKVEHVKARPASDKPDHDANVFTGYHYVRYKGVKDGGNASPALQSRTSKESSRASRALMSSTIQEILGVFFREQQVLVSGARIHVNLATYPSSKKDERAFLPHKLVQVFPLSDEGAEGISRMLGFPREALQNTIDRCNARNYISTSEVSACLSSVEGIADFVSSTMGSNQPINAYDSILNASNTNFSGQTFLVESAKPLKKDIAEPTITCHDMSFPFRVFYCHYAVRTMVFRVKLQGEDGTSHERLSVCHYDTSSWHPEHQSFIELNTKPGEAEACHWLGKSWMGQSDWVFSFA